MEWLSYEEILKIICWMLKAKKLLLSKNSLVQKLAVKLKSVGYYLFGDTEEVIRSGNL